jgi:hypothetical protein
MLNRLLEMKLLTRLFLMFVLVVGSSSIATANQLKHINASVVETGTSSVSIMFSNSSASTVFFKPEFEINGVKVSRGSSSMIKLDRNGTITLVFSPLSAITQSTTGFATINIYSTNNTKLYEYNIDLHFIVTPLPVELVSFKANYRGMFNLLEWETASETNSERFDIESSPDGRSFKKVGEVKSSGTTSLSTRYSFNHYFNHKDIIHYRLKQIDLDGSYEYSKVVISKPSSETRPFSVFKIEHDEIPKTIYVYDTNGKMSKTIEINNIEPNVTLLTGYSVVVLITDRNRYSKKLLIK